MVLLDSQNRLYAAEATPVQGTASSANDSLEKIKASAGANVDTTCKWACQVGPMPIGGAPLSESLTRGYPDPNYNTTSTRREVGLALLRDGLLLHIFSTSGYCGKTDIYNVVKEFNPIWYQNFDGGGSAGLIDKNDTILPKPAGDPGELSGRMMQVAFIIKRCEEIPSAHIKARCVVPPGYVGENPCG